MAAPDLRTFLQEQPPPVRYDVARGLARHRALVDADAPLPDWAAELPAPARSRWLRRAGWLTGVLMVATVAFVRPPAAPREPVVASPPEVRVTQLTHVEPRVEPMHADRRATSAPVVEPLAPNEPTLEQLAVARVADEVATEARATEAREPVANAEGAPRTRPRRHAPAPSPVSAPSRARNTAEIVAPEDNVELQQLVEAERALAGDPLRALKLARDGEQRFRNGYFAQERRYLEVMALFGLARFGEAHALATGFLHDYPSTPYRQKIELAKLKHPLH